MPKQFILYNLADGITAEEYEKYTQEKKGPFLVQLPSVKSFTLLSIQGMDNSPYQYVGIMDASSPEELQKDTSSPAFGSFLQEWLPKVKDVQMLFGMEVFQGSKK